jgi:hypothetical protein
MDLFIWIPIIFLLLVGILGNLTDFDDTVGLQLIGFLLLVFMPCVGYVIYYM